MTSRGRPGARGKQTQVALIGQLGVGTRGKAGQDGVANVEQKRVIARTNHHSAQQKQQVVTRATLVERPVARRPGAIELRVERRRPQPGQRRSRSRRCRRRARRPRHDRHPDDGWRRRSRAAGASLRVRASDGRSTHRPGRPVTVGKLAALGPTGHDVGERPHPAELVAHVGDHARVPARAGDGLGEQAHHPQRADRGVGAPRLPINARGAGRRRGGAAVGGGRQIGRQGIQTELPGVAPCRSRRTWATRRPPTPGAAAHQPTGVHGAQQLARQDQAGALRAGIQQRRAGLPGLLGGRALRSRYEQRRLARGGLTGRASARPHGRQGTDGRAAGAAGRRRRADSAARAGRCSDLVERGDDAVGRISVTRASSRRRSPTGRSRPVPGLGEVRSLVQAAAQALRTRSVSASDHQGTDVRSQGQRICSPTQRASSSGVSAATGMPAATTASATACE